MSDLTERLRELASCKATFGGDAEAFAVAADEIDRITAALAEARDKALEEAAKVADGNYDHIGVKTKHDKCPHDRFGWEDCDQCAAAAIRALEDAE